MLFFVNSCCKYARDKKIQEKQKKLNSLPPILHPKNKKIPRAGSCGAFQQKIRPGRFVDTDKLNRKQWARTEVALNPFLYGKKDELTMVHQSPLKTLQSNDNPDESLDGAFSFPQFLSAAFGNSPDIPDGGPEQTSERELYFGQGVWNGAQNQGRGDAVATSSGLIPKKVWTKKRFVDTKADKAKKRASSKFK